MRGKLLRVNPALQGASGASAPSADTSLPKRTRAPEFTEPAQTFQRQAPTRQEPQTKLPWAPHLLQSRAKRGTTAPAVVAVAVTVTVPGPGRPQKHARRLSRAPLLSGTFPLRSRTRQPTSSCRRGAQGSTAWPSLGTAGSTCVTALARSVSAGAGRHIPAARRPGNQTVNTSAGRAGWRVRRRGGACSAPRVTELAAEKAGQSGGARVSHRPPEGRAAGPRRGAAGRGGAGRGALPRPLCSAEGPGEGPSQPRLGPLRCPLFTRLRERARRGPAGAGLTLETSAVISGTGSGTSSGRCARRCGWWGRGAALSRPGGRSAGDEAGGGVERVGTAPSVSIEAVLEPSTLLNPALPFCCAALHCSTINVFKALHVVLQLYFL